MKKPGQQYGKRMLSWIMTWALLLTSLTVPVSAAEFSGQEDPYVEALSEGSFTDETAPDAPGVYEEEAPDTAGVYEEEAPDAVEFYQEEASEEAAFEEENAFDTEEDIFESGEDVFSDEEFTEEIFSDDEGLDAVQAAGSGTSDDPYVITTADEFPTVIPEGETYVLGADITLKAGQQIATLAGVLDGKGHTITLADKPLADDVSGTIQNLGVTSAGTIALSADYQGSMALSLSGTIQNSYSTVDLQGTMFSNVGGLVGQLKGGSVKNSYYMGTISGTYVFKGGLVAQCITDGSLIYYSCCTESQSVADGTAHKNNPQTNSDSATKTVAEFQDGTAVEYMNTGITNTGFIWADPPGGGFPILVQGGVTPTPPVGPVIDWSELNELIMAYGDLSNTDYTKASWDTYKAAVDSGKALKAGNNVTQDEVDAACTAIKNAKDSLAPVDWTTWRTLYNEYINLRREKDDYTTESWDAYEEAVNACQTLFNQAPAESQAVVDAACEAIKTAKGKLASLTELDKLIEAFDPDDSDRYAPVTWQAYADAVAEGKELQAKADATEAERNAACEKIKTAKAALRRKQLQEALAIPESAIPIRTAEELMSITAEESVKNFYVLANDIVIDSDYVSTIEFDGILDGAGNAIIFKNAGSPVFANIGANAVLQNIGFRGTMTDDQEIGPMGTTFKGALLNSYSSVKGNVCGFAKILDGGWVYNSCAVGDTNTVATFGERGTEKGSLSYVYWPNDQKDSINGYDDHPENHYGVTDRNVFLAEYSGIINRLNRRIIANGLKWAQLCDLTPCLVKNTVDMETIREHSWNEGEITKQATCVDKGEKTFTCVICEKTRTEELPVNDAHAWDEGKVTKEATCKEKGERVYTCTLCGETKKEETPFGGHKWSAWKTTSKATLFAKESQKRSCSVCGKTETRTVGSPLKLTKEMINSYSTALNSKAGISWSGNRIAATWGKVSVAQGYEIYANVCGSGMKLVKTVKGSTTSLKIASIGKQKLSAKKNYKVRVRAYCMINGKKQYVADSLVLHVAAKNSKTYTNAKKVKLSNTSYVLKKGATAKLSASVTKQKAGKKLLSTKHAARLRYLSSNAKVATVTSSGKIKAVGKGTCYVYVVAQNGTKTRAKITVK